MSEKLTVKELKFVAGIIKGLSQTEACIRNIAAILESSGAKLENIVDFI